VIGGHPGAQDKAKSSIQIVQALVGKDRLEACMKGEDLLSDMLT